MSKVAGLRVRLELSVTGLRAPSYRSIQNFDHRSKRLVMSLATHVLWNEKNTGAVRHESDRNTPNDRILLSHFVFSALIDPRWASQPLRILIHLQPHVFAKIHQSEIYASAVKKNNPIKANMLFGIQAATQGGSAPLWPREMQKAESTQ